MTNPITQSLKIDFQDFTKEVGHKGWILRSSINDVPLATSVLFFKNTNQIIPIIKDCLDNLFRFHAESDALDVNEMQHRQYFDGSLERLVENGPFRKSNLSVMPHVDGEFAVELWTILNQIDKEISTGGTAVDDIKAKHILNLALASEKIAYIGAERRVRPAWHGSSLGNPSEEDLLLRSFNKLGVLEGKLLELLKTQSRRFTSASWPKYIGLAIASLGLIDCAATLHNPEIDGGRSYAQWVKRFAGRVEAASA